MGVKKRVSRKSEAFITIIATFMLAGILCFGISLGKYTDSPQEDFVESSNQENTEDSEDLELEEEPEILMVDFQSVIDDWTKTVGGNKSVLVYDLDLDKLVGVYNPEETYNTASLYKLFVVYEGYKRIQAGIWNGEAKAGSTGYTINKCLDLAIRESYSPCAETLWSMIGHGTLDNIISEEWGIVNSNISKLTSNVNDLMLIMKRFYEHPDFDDPKLVEAMWDSFLNQPETTYDWRQGLPSGFTRAEVYDKVGWAYNANGKYWNIYHDAAIVKFPLENGTTRNYAVVVMTNKLDFKNIRRLGTNLENKFYEEVKI